jgi:hypothetical protein
MALPLSELNLDVNSFNKYLFARLFALYTPEGAGRSPSAAPLPVSQIMYDGRVAFLFHPLAIRSALVRSWGMAGAVSMPLARPMSRRAARRGPARPSPSWASVSLPVGRSVCCVRSDRQRRESHGAVS